MKILIAVDRSEYARIVVEHGLDQAARGDARELHVLTVVDDAGDLASTRDWLTELTRDLLDAFGSTERGASLHVRAGAPAATIAAYARELDPDLLVIGRFSSPSLADDILDLVACPTLVVNVDGHDLEPQCPDCGQTRIDSDGEVLFCSKHAGDYSPDLTRIHMPLQTPSRLW